MAPGARTELYRWRQHTLAGGTQSEGYARQDGQANLLQQRQVQVLAAQSGVVAAPAASQAWRVQDPLRSVRQVPIESAAPVPPPSRIPALPRWPLPCSASCPSHSTRPPSRARCLNHVCLACAQRLPQQAARGQVFPAQPHAGLDRRHGRGRGRSAARTTTRRGLPDLLRPRRGQTCVVPRGALQVCHRSRASHAYRPSRDPVPRSQSRVTRSHSVAEIVHVSRRHFMCADCTDEFLEACGGQTCPLVRRKAHLAFSCPVA